MTTEEILAATKSTREELYAWSAAKLLARPMVTASAQGRPTAAWPAETLARVRVIQTLQRQGASPEEISAAVRERWPTGRPAPVARPPRARRPSTRARDADEA